MLSALIRSEHSYPALPLAGQLADQRFVHSGPLVTLSIIANGADYIFTLTHFHAEGVGVLWNFNIPSWLFSLSRYGVRPKIEFNSFNVFLLLVA